ncbi:electron transport complex subunit RsxG [Shewanella surugensis]|uniref:Ion-translocating oxidoreductase complex subunit G n=1 Tax=Shewanella surugensis TaxID=212020 RepID=A0ABT0LFX4_9GAMM|nr:electron transport complex subunit RsxG [Shewanella surugensis]MCL1126459.1 electron transport complex subunit RsxG [Shewanella surugensis]
MKKAMLKNGLILALFALICTALVAVVNHLTADQIKQQETQELGRILQQIIPTNLHDNVIAQHCIRITAPAALGTINSMPAYIASKNGIATAIAMETIAPDGYNGNIRIIVGIDAQGRVLGVRTLAQQETPGLGDKIEIRKSDWVNSFQGMILNAATASHWKVKKDGGDIDQFTGATITPRAYVKAVKNTLNYFNQHKTDLLNQPAHCEAI